MGGGQWMTAKNILAVNNNIKSGAGCNLWRRMKYEIGSLVLVPVTEDGLSLAGNLQLLIGWDDQQGNGALTRLDKALGTLCRQVACYIKLYAQSFKSTANLLAYRYTIFTNASGKDHGIDSAQYGGIGTDIFFDSITEHFQGLEGAMITQLGQPDDLSHVADLTESLQTAFLIQYLINVPNTDS